MPPAIFSATSLLSLPNEIIVFIATELTPKDMDSLIRSHPQFHCTLYSQLFSLYQKLESHSALYCAAKDGTQTVVERLLECGPNLRWKSSYWTCTSPWRYAKHHRMVKDHAESSFQRHPISAATANGHTGIVLKLLDHGTDINFKDVDGRSPLSLAARNGHMNTVRALMGRGANLLSIDMDGHRAIANAASQGHHEIEDYLLALLYTIRPRLEHTIKTEKHFMMFYAAARGDEDRIRVLLQRGVEVDSQLPVHSHTPLCASIWRGAPLSTIKLLLDGGSSPSSSFSRKRRREVCRMQSVKAHAPLQKAIEREDSYEIIKMLIQHGMRLDIDYRILRRLIQPQKFGEFCLLVDAGMDILGDPRLFKCLYCRATEVQCRPIIDMLVEMGADHFEHIQVPGRLRRLLKAGDRRYIYTLM
ncbi:ankyrin repeat-containing domain protein [Aspergillus stella-maris]|uniref:ankyrin repeat-containing domain protein n=1 Tax=Aspergillus stella-maris TaxID=1810926 RepID=UPI003CCE504A